MILTIERRSFHIWDKGTGIVNFPNRFELRFEDGKNFIGIYTAKRNGRWFAGLCISLTDTFGKQPFPFGYICSFWNKSYRSEKAAFAEVYADIRKHGAKLPKSWWKELDAHLKTLHDR